MDEHDRTGRRISLITVKELLGGDTQAQVFHLVATGRLPQPTLSDHTGIWFDEQQVHDAIVALSTMSR